ncbi:RNA polymerase recycling motor HelD [Thalassobacillus hwangdonensis]|uniref:RNA polymerase recycling motor HelD n=1 Tax=Thalassobacillus hwangdonensis TaxID=546108 RepID=A0ABW3KZ83_9BACI
MNNHPDYKNELERLDFTKAYMDTLIAAQESDQTALKEKQADALQKLSFKDSSLRYQEMLAHASFMKMSKEQLENLKRLRKKPYFARINFHRKEKTEEEIFYIGKVSLFDRETQMPIILDWRSPLANVYYEGRLGAVTYDAHGETYEGNVSLKRQYTIEDGELKDFRDIDLTTKDELLQDSLAQNSEGRLSEIVSTIQEEQNQVIRANLRKPIIVQGAAGSGKTTIALHRISYFLYSMKEIFKPEEMLILAPNQLFIQYISEVLPELGVQKARQTTYADYVTQVINLKHSVITQHETLMRMLEDENDEKPLSLWTAEFKGSPNYKRVVDKYLEHLKKSYLIDEDFVVAGFKVKNGKNIKRLFLTDFSYFPYQVRVNKIKAILQSELRRKKKIMLKKIADKYDRELDRALFDIKDPDKRRVRVSFLLTKKEEKLAQINREARGAVKRYMDQYPRLKVLETYRALFEKEALYEKLMTNLPQQERNFMKEETLKVLSAKKVHAEDLAALLYLKTFLYGIDKDDQAKKVIIDEAQDYSYFEIYSLRKAFQTELFTIVGDLAQGIYRYRGLKNWDVLKDGIFTEPSYLTLQKTYRTTVEIMELANQLLALMPDDLPKAEPVVRHGNRPLFIKKNGTGISQLKNKLPSEIGKGMKSFAVVTKTRKEAEALHEDMSGTDLGFELMDGKNEMGDRMILPAYLAKGLEFDVIFLMSGSSPYKLEELDLKMLYVSMTRPLHRLYMIGDSPEEFLLHKVKSDYYDIE